MFYFVIYIYLTISRLCVRLCNEFVRINFNNEINLFHVVDHFLQINSVTFKILSFSFLFIKKLHVRNTFISALFELYNYYL